MELIFTWVIQAEHTGAFSQNPSFAWIKKNINKNCTGTRHPVLQKGHFHTTHECLGGSSGADGGQFHPEKVISTAYIFL